MVSCDIHKFPIIKDDASHPDVKSPHVTVCNQHYINKTTVDLPNFENVPYFEHHVNKGFSKPATYKLINLVHKDVFRLVKEVAELKIVCLYGFQNKVHVQN